MDEQSRSHLRRLPHVIRLFRPCYGALRCGDEPLEINKDILVRVSSPSPEYNDRLSSDPSSYFFGPVVVNFIFCVFFYATSFAMNIKMPQLSELCELCH